MRRALKILLISGAFIVLVAGLGIYALVRKFNRDVVGIKQMQAERYNEVERIKALPELQAIVVSAGTVRAPFSHTDVAAYALTQALDHRRVSSQTSAGPLHLSGRPCGSEP